MYYKQWERVDYIGQWDENIVKAIYEEKNSDFMKDALKKSVHTITQNIMAAEQGISILIGSVL